MTNGINQFPAQPGTGNRPKAKEGEDPTYLFQRKSFAFCKIERKKWNHHGAGPVYESNECEQPNLPAEITKRSYIGMENLLKHLDWLSFKIKYYF